MHSFVTQGDGWQRAVYTEEEEKAAFVLVFRKWFSGNGCKWDTFNHHCSCSRHIFFSISRKVPTEMKCVCVCVYADKATCLLRSGKKIHLKCNLNALKIDSL